MEEVVEKRMSWFEWFKMSLMFWGGLELFLFLYLQIGGLLMVYGYVEAMPPIMGRYVMMTTHEG